MHEDSSWDFRESQELAASREYNKEGFIIRKADLKYLELIKNDIERIYFEFSGISTKKNKSLKMPIGAFNMKIAMTFDCT